MPWRDSPFELAAHFRSSLRSVTPGSGGVPWQAGRESNPVLEFWRLLGHHDRPTYFLAGGTRSHRTTPTPIVRRNPAPHTGLEPVSLRRQRSCDTRRIMRHLESSEGVEPFSGSLGPTRPDPPGRGHGPRRTLPGTTGIIDPTPAARFLVHQEVRALPRLAPG